MTQHQPDYVIQQTSSTSGFYLSRGTAHGVALGLLMVGLADSPASIDHALDYPPYKIHHQSSTYSQFQNMFTGAYDQCVMGFEETLAQCYAELLAKQEPLGKEFETVLYDNLWDLYVDT